MMNITISELIGQLSELRLESAASLKELLARYHDWNLFPNSYKLV